MVLETKESKYQFTTDWVGIFSACWNRTLSALKGKEKLVYLEIGVFEGRSLIWILDNVLTHPTSKAIVIDTFEENSMKTYFDNIKASGYENKIETLIGNSKEKLRELPLETIDIIYVDGSHFAHNVLADAVLAWMVLKVGGIIIFDDYGNQSEYLKGMTPKLGIDAFVSAFANKLEVLHSNYQFILKKKSN